MNEIEWLDKVQKNFKAVKPTTDDILAKMGVARFI